MSVNCKYLRSGTEKGDTENLTQIDGAIEHGVIQIVREAVVVF